MEVFDGFTPFVSQIYQIGPRYKTLIQVYIKNLDQIGALLPQEEVGELKSKIFEVLKQEFNDLEVSEIFSYNNMFYCFVNDEHPDHVRSSSTRTHNGLINDGSTKMFPDLRIVAIKIPQSPDYYKLIKILSDQTYYMNVNFIFHWIENPEQLLHDLKEDYNDLFELRKSVLDQTACFAFQPIIKCNTGEIAYHECLLRLNNHDHKLISAGSYIMLAEKYGYITSVDRYVFDMTMLELKSAHDIQLSVNISNIGVQDKSLVNYIEKLIVKADVGQRMIIEITETAMNDSYEQTKYFVEAMKSIGCKIALDDFGAGYTSFNQMRCFPVDIIKIDGSFIRNITTNGKNKILVEALIKTAEELGCKTVAEFVENGAIAKQLIELKVDYMQGNFFSPALNYRSWEKN